MQLELDKSEIPAHLIEYFEPIQSEIPRKSLQLIPARFALAMQADGWILRSEVIWHKPNPMPESVTDRPTKAHEQIYLFSKRERYFYDADAVREPMVTADGLGGVFNRQSKHSVIGNQANGQSHRVSGEKGQIIECETCGTKVYRQRTRLINNHHYCSWACRDHRADARASTKERVLRFPTRKDMNRLELAGRDILNGIGVSFLEQQIIGGKFVVDVLIPDAAIIIQWDGDFWHGNPAIYSELVYPIQQSNVKRDRACNAYLTKCGYRVLRFWEIDVHTRSSWVASEVVAALASSPKT